ncbi:MAG: 4Fe-4S dicluster domain-containing protein [Armatimonadetes bacterium]|nr:4Fe-4S dicluster domain-containing protein [Armatimonadota bacterium]
MINTLLGLLHTKRHTTSDMLPDLADHALTLATVSDQPCAAADGCRACLDACPTSAVTVLPEANSDPTVTVDRGRCLACRACTDGCPTSTLVADRNTRVAVRTRAELLHSNRPLDRPTPAAPRRRPFARSLHIREVSTGDNAADMEIQAACNPIYDCFRFGLHFVASPRHADALLVTGPVGRAMAEPLRRCHAAMAEPRLVIALGCAAISGGIHAGGYAEANGVDAVLPVDVYVPGGPPHPWMILHGLFLAMGHPLGDDRSDPQITQITQMS